MPRETVHSSWFTVNSKKQKSVNGELKTSNQRGSPRPPLAWPRKAFGEAGVFPLFLLIAIGIAVLAGGSYIIREQFVKTGKSGQSELDKQKVREQVQNPKPLPSLSPTPKAETQYGTFKYKPSPAPNNSPGTQQSGTQDTEPAFSINPPSGWSNSGQTDSVIKVVFLAPEKDEVVAGEDLKAINKAKIAVNMVKGNGSGTLESFVEYFINSSKADWESLEVNSKSKTTFAGQAAYKLEMDVFKKGVNFRTLSYAFIKGKYGFVVYGGALESAWNKRAQELQTSINSFKFID